jgi:hypothetical protein
LADLQSPLGFAVVARVLDILPNRRDEEHLETHIYARLFAGERQWLGGYLRTGNAGVPPIRFPADGDGLGGAVEWQRTVQPDGNTPNLGEAEDTTIQHRAAMLAHLRIGEAVVAVPALEAGITGRLAHLDAAEERLKGLVQAVQHILQDLRVEVAVFGPHLLDARQLRRLHGEAHGDVAFLPRQCPFFQPGVVQLAAAPQDRLQHPFLRGRWHQAVLEGFAHTLLFHTYTFCLIGGKVGSI